jgi:REP element-mobilizing transposase RayT
VLAARTLGRCPTAEESSYAAARLSPITRTGLPCCNGVMPTHRTPTAFPPSGHAALRRGRSCEAGRSYLVTFTTRDRQRRFLDFDCACAAAAAITEPRLWRSSHLLAWVLMPDHWHGLVQMGSSEQLGTAIGRVKAISARHINARQGGQHTVWSRAFHDRALHKETDLMRVARYLVANPLRAGLVEHIGDYPFWGAVWL